MTEYHENTPAPKAQLPDATAIMRPVEWQGQIYYTSQYFHRQYLANKPEGGKYREHRNFLRVLRGIEAYEVYISRGDVVELAWTRMKSEPAQDLSRLKPLFKATGYADVMLINATFQVALSNFLDDLLSQQMAVAANTLVARQAMGQPPTGPAIDAQFRRFGSIMSAFKEMARAISPNIPDHVVILEGLRHAQSATGLDATPLLGAIPELQNLPYDEDFLNPEALSHRLEREGQTFAHDAPRGAAINRLLRDGGWQARVDDREWRPTQRAYADGVVQRRPYSKELRPGEYRTGFHLYWKYSFVRQVVLWRARTAGA